MKKMNKFCFFLFQYPHAVGYVADISTGDRAVGNQAKLSGVGYANGLACGYVMAVIILLGAGTVDIKCVKQSIG